MRSKTRKTLAVEKSKRDEKSRKKRNEGKDGNIKKITTKQLLTSKVSSSAAGAADES